MTRIFIEGNELDVNQGFTHQLNFSVDDLNNLDSKTTSFSKTIVLPATANNNRLLGNIFEFGNSNFTNDYAPNVEYNFNASKSAQVRIEMDGVQVMKGVLRLLEIIIDGDNMEYEVALFGELGGFFSKLGAKKISDLDFSAYNHTYNISNIENSWNNANAGSGYYYPLIDYGNCSSASNPLFAKKNYYYRAFRPALFVREYLDKIIKDAGYTWESNFCNTNFFKRLIVPNNQNKLAYLKSRIFSASPTSTVNIQTSTSVTFQNAVLGNFTTTDNKTFKYTGATTFTGSINCNFVGTWQFGSGVIVGNCTGVFNLYKNGSLYQQGQVSLFQPALVGGFGTIGVSNPFNIQFSFGGLLNNISLATNDEILIKFEFYSGVGADGLRLTFTGNSMTIDTPYPIMTPAVYGDSIRVSDTIPSNVLQKDFFSSILKMFNLMVTEDKYVDRKLIIEPYVDFYNVNSSSYLDWSDKVHRGETIRIKPMSEVNARYYQFKFKQDSDYYNEQYRKKYNENYGDRVFDNNLEFAKETESLEVIFAPTPLVGYNGEDKVVSTIYKLNNNVEESTEHIIRILQAKKITGVTSYKIYNSTTTLGIPNTLLTTTNYGYAGHLDDPDIPAADLNFGSPKELFFELVSGALSNNIFNAYYSPYMAETTDKDSRLLKCKVKLNSTDIFNLDFGRFIRIDGVLYRLIKVIDFSEGELTSVELLRVIYTTY